MRKIEEQMLKAIRSQTSWKSGNTKVVYFGWPNSGICTVYLHNTRIATTCNNSGLIMWDIPNLNTRPTPTTRSRVRALKVGLPNYTSINGAALANLPFDL